MAPDVEKILAANGVRYAVHQHPPLITLEALKTSLPFEPETMVKGLAFRLPGGSYAIVALRGADRADYKSIADTLSIRRSDLRSATPEELMADLGMEVGGVVPLPVRGARILVDEIVQSLSVIYCGTGRNTSTLEIAASDLIRLSQGAVGLFAKR